MTNQEQREAARQFYYRWNGQGREDEDARSYWIELLDGIFGMTNTTQRLDFEKKVIGDDGNTKRIDVYIPETRVLIEQKSIGIPLDKPQAGHNGQTPYEQAKYYDNCLPFEEKSRWIITSNFSEIWIYDMNQKAPEPVKLLLSDLQSKYHLLSFLINKETKEITDETKVSLQAGELVGKLYDAFLKQYKDPEDPENLKSLNKLCVRIVFCLYAEDADVFPKNRFHDYMAQTDAKGARRALVELFKVLDQKLEERDEFLEDDDPILASFPYVNGGLFAEEDISIPPLTDEILDLLLRRASDEFDWSEISPTIFGAVFESTLNPETRRSGGMHYTSIENIHKVIDPLFLDDLKQELAEINSIAVEKTRVRKLKQYQDKLASLTFLDPAAGSGNFLTETYLCLRRLENEVIDMLQAGQVVLGVGSANPIKVSIDQFYGIEINDFAVTVARAALWIAESQMMKETEDIVQMPLDFLPLRTNAHIEEGNALRKDWNDVVDKKKLNYIMGNPPFVGARLMTARQRNELLSVYNTEGKGAGSVDYVTAWYCKAADYISQTDIRCAFVSTNSITQGEQPPVLWKKLYEYSISINFAYRSFVWTNEAKDHASVHCVIIGFSTKPGIYKLYESNEMRIVGNINPYLLDAPNILIESTNKPICDVPSISTGNQATDDGNFYLNEQEYEELVRKYPEIREFIHLAYNSHGFINNKKQYCLWLKGASPRLIYGNPEISRRVKNIKTYRRASTKKQTREMAEYPSLFTEDRQPEGNYIVVPKVSGQSRRYVPMGFLPPDVICNNTIKIIPNATLFHFGILESNVHMSWMRAICGRTKSDYQYSNTIVYNNFPWPSPTEDQKAIIEKTAQGILDARAIYPDSSLAELYDSVSMPPELLKAHQANDRAVMKAYGMPIRETDEAACVAWLMELYQEKVEELEKGKK